MELLVLGSTKQGYNIAIDDALKFSSYAAGVCYMKEDVEDILNEDIEKTKKRIDLTLNNGHHSVFQHVHYSLVFKDIPKIVAMLINNERPYTTSEKSARYTVMDKVPDKERQRYNKWRSIFKELIAAEYPLLDKRHVDKLAMENARYMISVFTPTTMVYTTNLCQINYIIEMLVAFVQKTFSYENHPFMDRLRESIYDFLQVLKPFEIEGMNRKNKNVDLSMIKFRYHEGEFNHYFGDVYDTYYWASFAQLAQAHRHRTLHYNIFLNNLEGMNDKTELYVPRIIQDTSYKDEWLNDLRTLPVDSYPQATKVIVRERGLYEHFILKCHERLCCQAQNEIMTQTAETFKLYKKHLEQTDPDHRMHIDFQHVNPDNLSKTQFKGMWCAGKCNNFGRRYALNRKA
mgnify:CR=1 FL=1